MKGKSSLPRFALWVLAAGVLYAIVRFFYVEDHIYGDAANRIVWVILMSCSASLIVHLWLDKICGRQDIIVALEVAHTSFPKGKIPQGESVTIGGRRINPKYWRFRLGRFQEMTVWRRRHLLLLAIFLAIWMDFLFILGSGGGGGEIGGYLPADAPAIFAYMVFMIPWWALRCHKDWVYDEVSWLKYAYLGSMAVTGGYCLVRFFEHFQPEASWSEQGDLALAALYFIPATYFGNFLYYSCRLMRGRRAYSIETISA